MHGNEEGGVIAVMRMLSRIERLRLRPAGHLVVLGCNLPALERRVRYVDHDLNRMWSPQAPRLIGTEKVSEYQDYLEISDYLETLAEQSAKPLTVIDLHSFSGKGFPFVIAPDSGCPENLVQDVPFPVIQGLNTFIHGTLCAYLEARGHSTMVLEGGQDADPAVPVNMEAFLWQALVRMKMIEPDLLPNPTSRTWSELIAEESSLPDRVRAVYRHAISSGDNFVMNPGFASFDPIKKGCPLATDASGPILAPMDGWLLMPLYQAQGDDGFFIAVETTASTA